MKPKKTHLSSILKHCVAIAIICFLSLYLIKHWHALKSLSNFTFPKIALMYAITLAASFIAGLAAKILLSSLDTKVKLRDMILLYNTVSLLNYIPFKFGTLFRANYLKKHNNLKFAHFGTFFIYQILIMTFTISVLGSIILLSICNIHTWSVQILLAIFIMASIISFIFLFIHIPFLPHKNKLAHIINNFLKGRNNIIKNKKIIFVYAFLMNINFILGALRLSLIYESLGQNAHPAGFLILGAAGYLTMFISLTPGSLGIREIVLGSTSEVIGIPIRIGIPAALFDRLIAITFSFVIGGICTIILWNKNPKDFKRIKSTTEENDNNIVMDFL
ncbi:MAG: flippase-like domain-containing protein [Candidatus Omnitrophica bacterium]|nr:flippase-like domain-containing protein [Candidatus Omnitrophota bacterium]